MNTWKICVPQWGRRKQRHLPNNSASQHSPPLPSPVSQTWLTNADIFRRPSEATATARADSLFAQLPALPYTCYLQDCLPASTSCQSTKPSSLPSSRPRDLLCQKPFPRFLHLSPSDYLSDNVYIRRFTRVDLMARFIWLPIALTPESESKTEERSCQRRLSKLRVKLSAHP